jgi:flagellar basal-body rod protein FlgF
LGDRILEVGAAGIEGADAKVRVMMNNMVNSETPGYRRSDVVIKSFPTYLEEANIRSASQVPQVESVAYDQRSGALLRTGNDTDIAIGGPGFFVIQTPQGTCYTRDGRFVLDAEGRLVTVSGNYPVSGLQGQIVVTPGSKLDINQDGTIQVDGLPVNSLMIADFKDPSVLTPITGSLFKAKDGVSPQTQASPRVVAGYVESSNVNVIEEMVNLINLSHVYTLDTKIVANREALLSKAMEMGKPSQ